MSSPCTSNTIEINLLPLELWNYLTSNPLVHYLRLSFVPQRHRRRDTGRPASRNIACGQRYYCKQRCDEQKSSRLACLHTVLNALQQSFHYFSLLIPQRHEQRGERHKNLGERRYQPVARQLPIDLFLEGAHAVNRQARVQFADDASHRGGERCGVL